MSCTDSNLIENSKGIESENMGDVLGRECDKEYNNTNQTREDADGATTSSYPSLSESEMKDDDVYSDSDDDTSWLLPPRCLDEDVESNKCECEGCIKRLEIHRSEQKNAKLMLSSWKEFRNFIRNVYINAHLESSQEAKTLSLDENPRIHEIVRVLRLCDPHQLFEKVEDETKSMVLESQARQLSMLKTNTEHNPNLAEEFITGLIEEYAKVLSSALYLAPAIEYLFGSLMQRFGLTYEMLNKHLYQSLVYNNEEIQNSLPTFIGQIRKMLPLKDDLNHELVHLYLAFDDEMTIIGSVWKNVEPLMLEHRNLRMQQKETQRKLQDALKAYLQQKHASSCTDDITQYCPKCMNNFSCPCDECTVEHMMSCEEDAESVTKTSSRSSSGSRQSQSMTRGEGVGSEHKCECHACSKPPADLIDCSLPLGQAANSVATHGEGFQLYPHIHGSANNVVTSLQQQQQTTAAAPTTSSSSPPSKPQHCEQKTKVKLQPRTPSCSPPRDYINGTLNIPRNMPVKSAVSLTPEQLANVKKTLVQRQLQQQQQQKTVSGGEKKSSTGVCATCVKHGSGGGNKTTPSVCSKNTDKHLAAIARLGLSSNGNPRSLLRCSSNKDLVDHSHSSKTAKGHSCQKDKTCRGDSGKKVSFTNNCESMECDDSSGPEDSCSERSNSTSTSTQKDMKHCDCCYCEVFGHGVPSVAPVSRNYQEMRERLRLRLNMKKKCKQNLANQKTGELTGNNGVLKPPVAGSKDPPAAPNSKQEDLDLLLKFIEGNIEDTRCDAKKAAKKARQKQKKIEEKERLEEEAAAAAAAAAAAERQRVEALKRQVAMNLVNNKRSGKGKNQSQVNNNARKNEPSNKQKTGGGATAPVSPLNLVGLKSLVEKRDIGAAPKMVTIKRVLEPHSAEPTVTITLKGSTPDKDKVLFTLVNGTDDKTVVLENKENKNNTNNNSSKKKNKKKEKCKGEVEEEQQRRRVVMEQTRAVDEVDGGNKKKKVVSSRNKSNREEVVVQQQQQQQQQQHSSSVKQYQQTTNNQQQMRHGETWQRRQQQEQSVGDRISIVRTRGVGGDKKDVSDGKLLFDAPTYRLSEVLNSIAPSPPPPPKEEISLENLRLPPGITITKIENPAVNNQKKTKLKSSDSPGHVSKPAVVQPPIIVSTAAAHSPSVQQQQQSSRNVIVVDTGKLKEVMSEQHQSAVELGDGKKKKKKKNKNKMNVAEQQQPVEIIQLGKQDNNSNRRSLGGPGDEHHQQATIIKTSDNMVTIRSPALQQAMTMNMNGYSSTNETTIDSLNRRLVGLDLNNDALTDSMNSEMFTRAMAQAAAAAAVAGGGGKKKKKKKKNGEGGGGCGKGDIEPVDSVFQPKDIDLDNGDIDDDERELEAFKRFCLQSIPSERKDKLKVNLNIKDIVLKKKSSAIGCS